MRIAAGRALAVIRIVDAATPKAELILGESCQYNEGRVRCLVLFWQSRSLFARR